MSIKKIIVISLCVALGSMFAGCTPESPPLDPLDQSSAVSAEESEKSEETSETESSAVQQSSENKNTIVAEHAFDLPVLWDDSNGELLEVHYRNATDNTYDYYSTDEEDMLKKLDTALKNIEVVRKTQERTDENKIILLYTAKNNSGLIAFENGNAVIDGKCYEIKGYEQVEEVLKEIADKYPEWTKKYDEWNHKMTKVNNRIKEMSADENYKKGDIETKRKMATELLNQLVKEGLVKEGSIYDNGEMISYTYNNSEEGVHGGISLKEFDPMMNGSVDGTDTNEKQKTESSMPDDALIGPTVNIKTTEQEVFPDANDQDLLTVRTLAETEKNFSDSSTEYKDLTSKTFTGKETEDGKRHQVLEIGLISNDFESDMMNIIFETQKQGEKEYYGVSVNSEGSEISSALLKSGEKIYAIDEENECIEIGEDELNSSKEIFDVTKTIGNIEKWGECNIDGNKLYYEMYKSEQYYSIMYYNGTKFYKGEIYSSDGQADSAVKISDIKDVGTMKLSALVYINFDLPVKDELFTIPQNVHINTDDKVVY